MRPQKRQSFVLIMGEAMAWGFLIFGPLLLFAFEAGLFGTAHQ